MKRRKIQTQEANQDLKAIELLFAVRRTVCRISGVLPHFYTEKHN